MANGVVTRPTARILTRWSVTRAGMTRISVLSAAVAAVWFTQADLRGALVGSFFLGAALFCDAVRARMRHDRRDSLTVWLAALLGRLREYVVYAGLAIGAVLAGAAGAWAWAAGALITLALRDSVVIAMSAQPAGAADGPAPRRGGGFLEAVDPLRPADRAPGDSVLTERLLGGRAPSGARHREEDAVRIRTSPAPRDPAPRPRGRHHAPRRPPVLVSLRRLLSFPQETRFLVIAATITIWDARVTFFALIVGCVLAVTGELLDPPARTASG